MARLRFGKAAKGGNGVRQSGADALQLVVDYVKQETLTPLKGLGRFLLFGIAGSIMLCAGLILLLVAFLRALQEQTGGFFSGTLTWAPYVIVCGAAVIVIALCAWRVSKGAARRRRAEEKA